MNQKEIFKRNWWKYLGLSCIYYSLFAGLMNEVPRLPILNESIRNLYYHVPMWFSMIALFFGAVVASIQYLSKGDEKYDIYATSIIKIGILFGVLGIITGMIWAKYTWGEPWSNDPKQNASAIALLVYFAYLLLRNSVDEPVKKARLSAVYNIFAFPIMIVLLFILPRMTDSLHPGNGGNPGFNSYDLDENMRLVFYPAVLGWILVGFWIAQIHYKISVLRLQKTQN
jgi:heme exporter protein C